ncbi:TerB family tellurite resistance protein [Streptomyces sp. NBC_01803]|uniref:TerB family tellurite resistance protein n=1 Tax=Streptomyces sp. NBC_01803 TaxID=2975946 RepID=UPI002DD857A4|nr:TerB family tellurite resistance protein [Streptomyces sp. NBC_01803]WSA47704.1 TerB family tellurite resistance protein [Streptomyces sp. NBC_01803]
MARLAGVRTAWRVVDDGDFFCAACGGDRCYQRLDGRRRFTLLGLPVLTRGAAEPVVECVSCRGRFPLSALDEPTTTRLSALLCDGVHTVALALLAAGGDDAAAARRTAVASVRAAGFGDCTEERLLTLQAAMGVRSLPLLDREVREALTALTPHLAAPGRESLLLHGARIALADGPYGAAEREMLTAVGEALRIPPADTRRLLAAAALPH